MKGTNATKVLYKNKQVCSVWSMVTRERSSSQLCAGFKIKRKPTPLFFNYSGEGKGMVFKKMAKPLKGWKQAQMSVRKDILTKKRIFCEKGGGVLDFITPFFQSSKGLEHNIFSYMDNGGHWFEFGGLL